MDAGCRNSNLGGSNALHGVARCFRLLDVVRKVSLATHVTNLFRNLWYLKVMMNLGICNKPWCCRYEPQDFVLDNLNLSGDNKSFLITMSPLCFSLYVRLFQVSFYQSSNLNRRLHHSNECGFRLFAPLQDEHFDVWYIGLVKRHFPFPKS